jgi:hypothetical protein
MATITLEIVGLYFKRDIDVPSVDGVPLTVKDVLDAAVSATPTTFNYQAVNSSLPGGLSLTTFVHVLTEPLTSTRGRQARQPGIYLLTEQELEGRDVVLAWQ